MARLVPAGTVRFTFFNTSSSPCCSPRTVAGFRGAQRIAVTEAQVAKLDVADDLARSVGRRNAGVGDFRLLDEDALDARHRRGAALEQIDDPTQRDDGPGQLHHVGVEGHEAADR